MMLADSLGGWSDPSKVSQYFRCFCEYQFFSDEHAKQLLVLWQLRHSIVHNGGTLTRADSQKVKRLNDLPDTTIVFEDAFISEVARKLHEIVGFSTRGLGKSYKEKLKEDLHITDLQRIEKLFLVKSTVHVWLKGVPGA